MQEQVDMQQLQYVLCAILVVTDQREIWIKGTQVTTLKQFYTRWFKERSNTVVNRLFITSFSMAYKYMLHNLATLQHSLTLVRPEDHVCKLMETIFSYIVLKLSRYLRRQCSLLRCLRSHLCMGKPLLGTIGDSSIWSHLTHPHSTHDSHRLHPLQHLSCISIIQLCTLYHALLPCLQEHRSQLLYQQLLRNNENNTLLELNPAGCRYLKKKHFPHPIKIPKGKLWTVSFLLTGHLFIVQFFSMKVFTTTSRTIY